MSHDTAIAAYRRQAVPKITLEQFGSMFDPPLHKATVLRWERHGVPPERVLEVERLTGINRHVLRPDIYGALAAAPEQGAAQ